MTAVTPAGAGTEILRHDDWPLEAVHEHIHTAWWKFSENIRRSTLSECTLRKNVSRPASCTDMYLVQRGRAAEVQEPRSRQEHATFIRHDAVCAHGTISAKLSPLLS